MTKKIDVDKLLEDINKLIETQKNAITDEYSLGLYNGMILIRSCITDEPTIFISVKEQNFFKKD